MTESLIGWYGDVTDVEHPKAHNLKIQSVRTRTNEKQSRPGEIT